MEVVLGELGAAVGGVAIIGGTAITIAGEEGSGDVESTSRFLGGADGFRGGYAAETRGVTVIARGCGGGVAGCRGTAATGLGGEYWVEASAVVGGGRGRNEADG